jgi:hypothetical protein
MQVIAGRILNSYYANANESQEWSSAMKIVVGHIGSDAGWTVIDTDTGQVTHYPGNIGGGPNSYEDLRTSVNILKSAAEIKAPELQKVAVRAACEIFNGYWNVTDTGIFGPGGKIIAIFDEK